MTWAHIKASIANLRATPLRTILTMLGIYVGTASVVAMVSTGQMATEEALSQFSNLGTDLIAVSLSSSGGGSSEGAGHFTINDALGLKSASPLIDLVAPYTTLYAQISYQGININGSIIGEKGSLASVIKIKILKGRYISLLDYQEKYCVIGYDIYEKIKPYVKNPIGTPIKLGDYPFVIVGIADKWPESAFFYQDINNSVIVPIATSAFLSKYADIDNIVIRLKPDADITAVKQSIEDYLSLKAPNKKIFIRSAKELVKSMAAQHKIFTLLLSFIGSISLFVGGIGVMNIMLVSVIERRREIGIRLAIGATRKEIQMMFLIEAVLLSVLGGLFGIIDGILASLIIAKFSHWALKVFLLPPLIGFSVSVLIGVFFGFYPAHKASQLDPIQTLRSE